ncbi:MAG: hypothetical protein D3925_01745 [Candidatus Electrothrix sp. AR5]|nr:hypothetical protein [Candidatus Electrothrix sp. AR5]
MTLLIIDDFIYHRCPYYSGVKSDEFVKYREILMEREELAASKVKEALKKWELLSAKLSALEKQKIVETRAEERFRLEQLIAEAKEERQHLEPELLQLDDQTGNTKIKSDSEKNFPGNQTIFNWLGSFWYNLPVGLHYFILLLILGLSIWGLFSNDWITFPQVKNNQSASNYQGADSNLIRVDRVRVALVIGNSEYKSSPLRGPSEDVKLVANSLRDVGFRVKVLQDAKKAEILDAWKYVETLVTYGGVALLYYSGHGSRINGDDAIVPVDYQEGMIKISSLMRTISAFEGKIEGASGELFLYSTKPGKMASDQIGGYSPFAKAFSTAVHETKGDIQKVFKRVSSETQKLTDGYQTPWISGSFTGSLNLQDRSTDRNIGIVRLIVFDASR